MVGVMRRALELQATHQVAAAPGGEGGKGGEGEGGGALSPGSLASDDSWSRGSPEADHVPDQTPGAAGLGPPPQQLWRRHSSDAAAAAAATATAEARHALSFISPGHFARLCSSSDLRLPNVPTR